MHLRWIMALPEPQVLTHSYLNGAALGLPATIFDAHFPCTAPVTLRNAAGEEQGGKLTRKRAHADCKSSELPRIVLPARRAWEQAPPGALACLTGAASAGGVPLHTMLHYTQGCITHTRGGVGPLPSTGG